MRVRAAAGVVLTGTLAAVLATGTGVASAATAATDPAPELAPLADFAGHWTCNGTATSPGTDPVPVTAVADSAFGTGGHWLFTDRNDTWGNGVAQESRSVWGWDAAQQKFVMHYYDSSGGFADLASAGWVDDTLVADGVTQFPDGSQLPSRATFSRPGASGYTSSNAVQIGGEWVTVYQSTCTTS